LELKHNTEFHILLHLHHPAGLQFPELLLQHEIPIDKDATQGEGPEEEEFHLLVDTL